MKTYPLLQSQLLFFLECQSRPGSMQYNLPSYSALDSSVDLDKLAHALQVITRKRSSLRIRFMIDDTGNVRQWSDPEMQIPIVRRKCSEAELQNYLENGFVRPFNLLNGEPLCRFEIIETEIQPYILFDFHQCIIDGTSYIQLTMQDLPTIYSGKMIEQTEYGIFEAAEDEQASFSTDAYRRAKEYYVQQMNQYSFAVIPPARLTPQTGNLFMAKAFLGQKECDEWCHTWKIHPCFLFQAAFALVVSRFAHEEKIAYISVYHGRNDSRLYQSFGMFIKLTTIFADVQNDRKIIDFVRSFHTELRTCRTHSVYPFLHLCRDFQQEGSLCMGFNYFARAREYIRIGDKSYAVTQLDHRDYHEPGMDVAIYLRDGKYEVRVEAGLGWYDISTISTVAEAIRTAVINIMSAPEGTLQEISTVATAE